MRGAEVLKREGMKLWNKFKTGRPMLTEITKQLTALRDRLTRAEGVSSCSHSFCSFIRCFCHRICTGSAFSEFGYNERPAITNRSLCMKIIGCNVKRFGYNEHFLLHLFTCCKRDPVYLFQPVPTLQSQAFRLNTIV